MEIQVAKRIHVTYATIISKTISSSAQVRGTGIARRTPEYIQQKISFSIQRRFGYFLLRQVAERSGL